MLGEKGSLESQKIKQGNLLWISSFLAPTPTLYTPDSIVFV